VTPKGYRKKELLKSEVQSRASQLIQCKKEETKTKLQRSNFMRVAVGSLIHTGIFHLSWLKSS
jgi:hypothetical protein